MTAPRYIDRKTHQEMTEKVYGKFYIDLLYGTSWFSHLLSFIFLPLFAHINLLSRLYGSIQKSHFSKKKILPFIEKFHVDTSEFLDPVDSYRSFNDFFIRKLKPESRPITPGVDIAILPADGRYLVYENIEKTDGFFVKGKKFSLEDLLRSRQLAQKYAQGSMAIARLAPVDYHRFHFPINCLPEEPQPICGPLFSVNPAALKKHVEILAENKRVITPLKTKNFGTVLFIEVGATYVGSIHQTFDPHEPHIKGDEKGYFSFGGSSLVLLFEPSRIQFDQDLIEASNRRIEVLGQMGQSLGRALNTF
jgi:phosphatidylserine decarboxylase